MKKVFFALALVMGLGTTVAFASSFSSPEVTVVTNVNDFKPVEVKDLPKAVQDLLKLKTCLKQFRMFWQIVIRTLLLRPLQLKQLKTELLFIK